MQQQTLARPGVITLLLLLQVFPLLLFPAASFAPTTQEWWLPVLLVLMVVIADFQLIVRRSTAAWPWYLISFAQGFSIISRLLMVWAHATVAAGDQTVFNGPYVLLTGISMLMSIFFLWYFETPNVRVGLLH
jgi:hypothetical protein